MKPESWREDGWPLCPVCGEDELADLQCREPASASNELYCYRCGRVTVKAGEGEAPAHAP